MNWQHIQYYEEVAKQQHFINAAKKLHITQPALSMAIASMEKELGVKLFQKTGRNVILTDQGKIFLHYVHQATDSIKDGMQHLKASQNAEGEVINVSSFYTFSSDILAEVIFNFRALHPQVNFHSTERISKEIVELLCEGKIAIGFCTEMDFHAYSRQLTAEPLLKDEIMLYVPNGHPFAARESVPFKACDREPIVTFVEDSEFRKMVIRWFDDEQLHMHVSATASNAFTVASYVKHGLGIAFLPNSPSIPEEGMKKVRISDKELTRTIYCVWRNGYIPSTVEAFRDYIILRAKADDSLPAHEKTLAALSSGYISLS